MGRSAIDETHDGEASVTRVHTGEASASALPLAKHTTLSGLLAPDAMRITS